jgi:glucose/arabinose dehydrogenase
MRPVTTAFSLMAFLTFKVISGPTFAADAAAGKVLFQQNCGMCHTAEPNDNGGGQGPSLIGIFGRRAGSNPAFGYTKALRDSNLIWDAPTLDRFLKEPTKTVLGTAMIVAVPLKGDRANLISYLKSVQSAKPEILQTAKQTSDAADWKQDKPGRLHRIDLSALPAPGETPSVRNRHQLLEKPADAKLSLPPGFRIDVFSRDLEGPRRMLVAPNGDIFVTETPNGRISILRQTSEGVTASKPQIFAADLNVPHGMAWYPNATNPSWLYVAENNRVVRFPYHNGIIRAQGSPEIVTALPSGGSHIRRDIVFSDDGRRMYVSVPSGSNAAEDMPPKTSAEIKDWEEKFGLGAAWGSESDRATVLVFDTTSKEPGRHLANGIRNCVGLTIQPETQELWCTTNERDKIGDRLVPDYSTRVRNGGFYGWPWYYMGQNEDPRHKNSRPDLGDKVLLPDVAYEAHSAALTLMFYRANAGSSAFPKEYEGAGFVTFHGSWNRVERTGHKIVRLRLKDGVPTGEYEDFLTGFIIDDQTVWGRPVGTVQLPDGSLLLSDDEANIVYRISYSARDASGENVKH